MEESRTTTTKKKAWGFWGWATASIIFRLILIYFPTNLNLSSRPEVSTPVTSLRRLAEGYWLKQASMSPYAGSMYHGSPLLLSVLGPLVVNRVDGQPDHILCRWQPVKGGDIARTPGVQFPNGLHIQISEKSQHTKNQTYESGIEASAK